MSVRGAARLARPVLLGLAVACAADEQPAAEIALPFPPAGPDTAPDPSTWGPFPVGVSTLVLTDTDRLDDDGSPRAIPVELWYPAETDEGEPATYALADFVSAARLDEEGIDPASLPTISSAALRDVAPDRQHGPYPLVVFSHGNGGIRVQSLFFTIPLASHGYVVAAPDHVGNTLADLLEPGANEDLSVAQAFADRPADVALTVEALLGAQDPAPVQDGAWGATGHSFGSWTALHAAGLDTRVAVVVAQAPVDAEMAFLGTGIDPDEVQALTMLEAGDADDTLEYEENALPSYEELAPPVYLATFLRAGHFTFSDLCVIDLGPVADLINDSVGDALSDGCGPDNVDPEQAFPWIRYYGVGALNAVLRNSPGSAELLLADPGEAATETVTVQARLAE